MRWQASAVEERKSGLAADVAQPSNASAEGAVLSSTQPLHILTAANTSDEDAAIARSGTAAVPAAAGETFITYELCPPDAPLPVVIEVLPSLPLSLIHI